MTLEEQAKRCQNIIERAPIGIYQSTPDGKFLLANRSLLKMMRLDNFEELVLIDLEKEWYHPDFPRSKFKEQLERDGEVTGFESVWMRKDGVPIIVRENAIAVRDANGGMMFYEGTVEDISDCKKAEIALTKAHEELMGKAVELERFNRDLGQFAFAASHDLLEPLRMITCYTALLEKRLQDQLDPDTREYIGYTMEGARRMYQMINDLLAFSNVARQRISPQPIRAKEVLERVLRNLKTSIDESCATVTYDSLPVVMADEIQLELLFQHLIENAIKYQNSKSPEVHVSAKKNENQWIFSIRDNGIGIHPRYFESIFALFKRLHTHEKYSGTGVGLAVSKRIVEGHGGQIWVESEMGKGATFYFSIEQHNSDSNQSVETANEKENSQSQVNA